MVLGSWPAVVGTCRSRLAAASHYMGIGNLLLVNWASVRVRDVKSAGTSVASYYATAVYDGARHCSSLEGADAGRRGG